MTTLYDKVFNDHVVTKMDENTYLIYITRQLCHEVTSAQSFEGLRNAGRKVRRPEFNLATVDHNIPTSSRRNFKSTASFIKEDDSRLQVMTLEQNVKDFGVKFFGMTDPRQGIVHVIGPEEGFTLPGTTVVCGDSHTSTHGAFGALAFGIGTSEVEHVLATQTLQQSKSKNMRILVNGTLLPGITSKDLVLHIIGIIGTAGGTGHVIEFAGEAIRALSMEARMSMCNMAIEGGARAGMIAPDDITFAYVEGRPMAPKGQEWDKALRYWRTLKSDDDAVFDVDIHINAADIIPTVTWGTWPQDALPVDACVPDPEKVKPEVKSDVQRAIDYMGLTPNMPLKKVQIDKVFIGSCTNSRIEDLRAAAEIVKGRKIAPTVKRAMVVPGSGLVKKHAEREGLDKVFEEAGFEWREAGCSMCLGMNPDILSPYERCASTSNRNFEGRQGALGRTHLMSPSMAAAAGITGYITDVREFIKNMASEARTEVGFVPNKRPKMAEIALEEFEYPDNEINEVQQVVENKNEQEVKDTPAGAPSAMPKFVVETGIAAPMHKANIDTDAIIPKQFLKTIKRTGLSVGLFYEMRHNLNKETGEMEKSDFCLNVDPWNKARILVVAGDNFGCGSSREHAPWALVDFGIRSVIAPSFGDIFYNNSLKNGLLPVRVPADVIKSKLMPIAEAGGEFSIDLPNQRIVSLDGEVLVPHFDVDEFRKHCLVNGLDDIGITMQKEKEIAQHEKMRKVRFSFFEGGTKVAAQPKKTTSRKTFSRPITTVKDPVSVAVDW